MKNIIIDNRMRKAEKDYLIKLGYDLVELKNSKDVYEEISAHPDIFCTKIANNLVVEPNSYEYVKKSITFDNSIYRGESILKNKYPNDIRYNVCIVGKYAIHNFKYTDSVVNKIIEKNGYEKVNVSQGYTNCSIAVIDEESVITSDKGIYEKLKKTNLNVLLIEQEDIKLLNSFNNYSKKNGFIGGALARLETDNPAIFVCGSLEKLKSQKIIKKFIKDRNLNIIEFKGIDLVDYGGIIEI